MEIEKHPECFEKTLRYKSFLFEVFRLIEMDVLSADSYAT